MAEALVAVGSIAAILQLADYSKRFLKFLKEYQEKSRNLPLSFQVILSQHHLLIRNLAILEARAQQNPIDDDSIPDVQILFDACRKEVDCLEHVLNNVTASGNYSRARSFIKAGSAMRYQKDIQRSAATFKKCFNALWLNYQTTYMPLPQASLTIRIADSNKVPRLVTVPGPPQSIPEVQTSLIVTKGDEQHVQQRTMLVAYSCNCRRREVVQSGKSWNLGSASVSSEVLTQHRRGCPFHERSAKHNRLSLSLKYTSAMLRIIAGVTMSLKYGAGCISLSPYLTLRGMRREGSPAFKLLEPYEWNDCHTIADTIARFNKIPLQLQQLIDDRLVSPYEIDENGSSLLSVAYHRFSLWAQPWDRHYPTESIIGLLKLFGNLGVPFNDIVFRDYQCSRLPLPENIAQYLEAMGADFDPQIITFLMDWRPDTASDSSWVMNHRGHPCQTLLCEKKFPDYAELLDCNTLQFAILQRRESQVEDLIKADPSAIHFQNAWGQSALHVAADWPWATDLLLARGADPYQVDTHGCTAIDYACNLGMCEVVRMLLEAGGPLITYSVLQEVVTPCANNNSRKLLKLIAFHLAIRRRGLLRIAETLLSKAILRSIVPLDEAIPDSSSSQLIDAVRAAGCATTSSYWLRETRGLYQCFEIVPAAADILYEAGFRYLEGQDGVGLTPLICTPTSAMIVWLYRRGVSFEAWSSPPATRIRLLLPDALLCEAAELPMYEAIGRVVRFIYFTNTYRNNAKHSWSLQMLSGDDIEALNIFLQDEFSGYRDSCCCPCCSGGCSPEVMFLKTIRMNPLPRFVLLVHEALTELHGRLAETSFNRLCQAAIRMTLFLDLGLRHLCCEVIGCYRRIRASEEEAEEIREEDRFLLERFEALLPKALSEWKESPKNFADFWRDFHREYICRQRNKYVDEPEIEHLRELGVLVHEEGEQGKYCGYLDPYEEGYCVSLCSDRQEEGEGGNEDEEDEVNDAK